LPAAEGSGRRGRIGPSSRYLVRVRAGVRVRVGVKVKVRVRVRRIARWCGAAYRAAVRRAVSQARAAEA